MEEEDEKELFQLHQFTADPKQDPLRLDAFLMVRMANVSRTRIRKGIDEGRVKVNGNNAKPSYKIRPRDIVDVFIADEPEEFKLTPENIPLDFVYEDNDLAVVNKAPGMVVHPGVGNYSGTLVNALAFYFNKDVPEGVQRPWLVHRIDKGTSGLLLVVKNEEITTELADQFKDHSIDREYWAIVWGVPTERKGTITGNIARSVSDRKKFVVYEDQEIGKHAVTHYEVIEEFTFASLVKCTLETGRTHQIRVHMKYLGHPLFNDAFYGGDKIQKGVVFAQYRRFVENCFKAMPRPALHARELGFYHPVKKERMMFQLEPPEDFMTVLNKWRNMKSSYQFRTEED